MRSYKLLSVILFLTCFLHAGAQFGDRGWNGDLPACITVENCSTQQIYVVIADRNQGFLDPECSETYEVPYGEHKVVAEGLEENVSSYVRVTKTYPYNSWAVHDDDFL